MAELREVNIPIGKRNYSMQTELDDYTLSRIVKIINDACDSINGDVGSDNKLLLVSLQLAYNLEKISRLLDPIDKRLDKLNFIETEKESD